MTAADSDRVSKPSSKRRVIAVPTDVAPPPVAPEITLEAFRELLVELTGRRSDVPQPTRLPR